MNFIATHTTTKLLCPASSLSSSPIHHPTIKTILRRLYRPSETFLSSPPPPPSSLPSSSKMSAQRRILFSSSSYYSQTSLVVVAANTRRGHSLQSQHYLQRLIRRETGRMRQGYSGCGYGNGGGVGGVARCRQLTTTTSNTNSTGKEAATATKIKQQPPAQHPSTKVDDSHLKWTQRKEAPKWLQRMAPTKGGTELPDPKFWPIFLLIGAGGYYSWFVDPPKRKKEREEENENDSNCNEKASVEKS